MADLTQVAVPYPVLLAEYQERVGALMNENIMLRASVAHLQRTPAAVPQPDVQAADAELPANPAPQPSP